jgi:hypothetical protein
MSNQNAPSQISTHTNSSTDSSSSINSNISAVLAAATAATNSKQVLILSRHTKLHQQQRRRQRQLRVEGAATISEQVKYLSN